MREWIDISKEVQKTPEQDIPKVSDNIAEKEEIISKAVSEVPVSRDEIEIRKEKLIGFIKNPKVWVGFFLVIAVILGIYLRSIPMHVRDDTGNPGLWDITKDSWTLGPDLDPWLFTRMAKYIVEDGQIPAIDNLRNVPLGFDTSKETRLLPYMIAYTYKLSKLFYSEATIEYAASLFPVIMFALTIISFFLFVREIFIRKSKESRIKANIISLISTFFMITIPVFLSRTIAGIPEKESAGFFFMFLSFYLFLKSWKSEKNKTSYIFAGLAGLSTSLMGLIWGGVLFVYISIAGATFIAFFLNQINKKEFVSYSLWFWVAVLITIIFSNRDSLSSMLSSISSGVGFFVFVIILTHFLLWKTRISIYSNKIKNKISGKIPKTIFSMIVALLILTIGSIIFFGPEFIIEKLKAIHQAIFKPVTGRWNTTVAENRQPYFTEWGGSFGPHIKGIALMFWLFFAGSILFFRESLKKVKKSQARILTFSFFLILIGMIFTRYSGNSLFNGETFISKAVYYLTVFLFIGLLYLFYYYYGDYKNRESAYKNINYKNIFLLTLFLLGIFSARGSVRTIMVLGPIAPIFASFLIVETAYKFKKNQKDLKIFLGVILVILSVLMIFTFGSYYSSVKYQAENNIPSSYNQQWQKAMGWIRESTPKDAVFAHWWDYGYWVQSIGERATVLDGGNAIAFWNYYMGRLVLTGDNQKDALDFLYAHDANYLLIDPTDIGKYGAYSSIGSNENYDRFSWIPVLENNPSQTKETGTGEIIVYQGGFGIDEDIIYNEDGNDLFLPAQKTVLIGILVEKSQSEEKINFKQPHAVFYYNGEQINLPMRHLEFDGEFMDFENGLEGCIKIVSKIEYNSYGLSTDKLGTIIYISPRVMKGYFAQKYLLNDPFGNFPNFKLKYQEPNLIIDSLRNQGAELNEFVYYNGILGPIKIWDITYTGTETKQERYLDKDSSKYLNWKL